MYYSLNSIIYSVDLNLGHQTRNELVEISGLAWTGVWNQKISKDLPCMQW